MSHDSHHMHRRDFLKRGVLGFGIAGGVGAAYASYSRLKRVLADDDRPTILLITLDTTRADHLGCYGYARDTTPHLDRLAAEATVYEQAISSSTWTLPAHASLFTGKFATSHGVRKAADGQLDLVVPQYGPADVNHYRAHALAADEQTLASLLHDEGYATAAVVAGPWMKRVFGMNRGFDVYDDDHIETVNARLAEDVTDRAMDVFRQSAAQPRFVFLNYFDPHLPYQPPKAFAEKFAADTSVDLFDFNTQPHALQQRISLYDGEIHYLDHHLGRLFDELRELDLYDDAWIVVTADHGEMLGEHNAFGHPGVVYREAVHVPLIVKPPRDLTVPGRVAARVQLVDVFALVLQAAGVDRPDDIQGEAPPTVGHPVIIESRTLPGINEGGDWFAIIEGEWKFAWNSEGNHLLFDLAADPREERNLFAFYRPRARAMEDVLFDYLASLPPPGPEAIANVDEHTHAQLKSLGYVR